MAAAIADCRPAFLAYFSDNMDIFQAQTTLQTVVLLQRAYKDVITWLEKSTLDLLAGTVMV